MNIQVPGNFFIEIRQIFTELTPLKGEINKLGNNFFISDEAERIHTESNVIDIHCHPSLKVNLFDYKIYLPEHHYLFFDIESPKKDEIFHMQYDLPKMCAGGVKGIWDSIYIVERGLIDHSDPLKFAYWLTKGLGLKFDRAVENNETPDKPFYQTLQLMETMEAQMINAQKKGFNAIYARSFDEFQQGIRDGKICFVHSIEGAHILGNCLSDPNVYLQRIESLSYSGVCSITLGHFMPNSICFPPNGISPLTKEHMGFHYNYEPNTYIGLTQTGKDVVSLMLDLGMIVDLNHVSPAGRTDVYSLNEARGSGNMRPLVFSHIGIREYIPNELSAPDEREILKIRDCNGVIGVIFMNYWLKGTESGQDEGIDNIIQTIQRIAQICAETSSTYEDDLNYNHIAIGSDMDGFTQPVDDLYKASQMQRLTQRMLDKGIKEENIKKVLGGNAMRVLELGWGK
ncbi:MAG: hypothetical protein EHM58_02090 [Ignavibacteriae bacterium]|nr:MAG: hypothetical protein EHM58_02090 [Ignavibacteriota bacterium]